MERAAWRTALSEGAGDARAILSPDGGRVVPDKPRESSMRSIGLKYGFRDRNAALDIGIGRMVQSGTISR